jgi:glycosyltransferase involved in cell wall biosynthesis
MPLLPLVSVIMGTYNGKDYLGEQLESLLAQTYPSLEFLICDDCSTDGTYSLLESYAAKDSRIKLFQNPVNLGFNLNFEKLCRLASGEFIAIADQDDIWELDKIQYMMDNGWQHAATVLIHSSSAVFKTGQPRDGKKEISKLPFSGNDVRKLFVYNNISGHNMIIRKSLLEQALPFPKKVYYDWWLAGVACCNGTITYVDNVLAHHRIHECNASRIDNNLKVFYLYVLETLPVLLTIPNMSMEAKRFGLHLLLRFKRLADKRYDLPLHFFLMKNAKTVFSFKKKRFPYFSYLKHSRRISTAMFVIK